jgi:hypothetical protein
MDDLREEVALAPEAGVKAVDRRRNMPAPAEAKLALRVEAEDLDSMGD